MAGEKSNRRPDHGQDLVGRRYVRLVVEELAGVGKGGVRSWRCRCDCGGGKVVSTARLNFGNVKSCGCLQRETRTAGHHRTHGMAKTPEWSIWCGVRKRCTNPACKSWPRYGGRGIRMCERWAKDFLAFYEDVGPRPSPAHMLDRIENEGHYEPGNVRWVTARASSNNRSTNRPLTHHGVTKTVAEWARVLGVSRYTLYARLRLGWPVEKVLAAFRS